jgi:hypothetical protein
MSFIDRLSNGWTITVNSFKVLKENKELIIFPILSGISMMLIMGSFVTILLAGAGWNFEYIQEPGTVMSYVIMFLYYLVNYFIVVFFNTALVHCTRLYFRGEEVSIAKGLQFSMSRIGAIFYWAVFAATVGTILRIIQENVGWLGKIITGIIGIVWSITTFFVVPVIAYENLGPIGAFKRSTQLMKEKWGESLGATFSFALIQFFAAILVALPLFFIGSLIHVFAGVFLAVLGILLLSAVMSATKMIFVSAVYHNITGDPVKHFNQQLVDNMFVDKKA